MAAVRSDRFEAPMGRHDERVLAWTLALALDALAGRTVWCAGTLPEGRAAAGRLRELLGEQVAVRLLAVAAAEPALIGAPVAPGDVVVLHDAPTVALAPAVRDHGGYAVWRVHAGRGVRAFPTPPAAGVDAYVVAWVQRRERREHLAALLPAAGLVDVKNTAAGSGLGTSARRAALAWTSVLGDVVEDARNDRVGGTLHVRPAVAPR